METKGWANRGERKSEGGRKCVRLGREKRRARMKTMEERGHTEDNTPLENQGTRKVVIDSPPLSLSHQRNWAVQYVRFPGGPPPEY